MITKLDGTHLELERAIKLGMPNNRKRSCIVMETDSKQISSYWSGGSIDKWSALHWDYIYERDFADQVFKHSKMKTCPLPPHSGSPMFGGATADIDLDKGDILICGGTRGGKPATPTVYANEATLCAFFQTTPLAKKYADSPMSKRNGYKLT